MKGSILAYQLFPDLILVFNALVAILHYTGGKTHCVFAPLLFDTTISLYLRELCRHRSNIFTFCFFFPCSTRRLLRLCGANCLVGPTRLLWSRHVALSTPCDLCCCHCCPTTFNAALTPTLCTWLPGYEEQMSMNEAIKETTQILS